MKPRLLIRSMCLNKTRNRLHTADAGEARPFQCAMVGHWCIDRTAADTFTFIMILLLVGQHVKHNEESGDNVGPLLVKK